MVGGELKCAASWPPDAATEDADRASAPGVQSHDVVLDGEHLGTLRVREPDDAPFGPIERRLDRRSRCPGGHGPAPGPASAPSSRAAPRPARHAADELQESRRRLVDTHDAERRRLERDIHDGAQQHLVALVVNLRLAQTLVGKAPDRARRTVLAEQVTAVDAAIATLVDLSAGSTREPWSSRAVGPAFARSWSGPWSRSPSTTTISAGSPVRSRPPVLHRRRGGPERRQARRGVIHHRRPVLRRPPGAPGGPRRRERVRTRGGLPRARTRQHARPDRCGPRALRAESDPGHGATVLATVPIQVEVAS